MMAARSYVDADHAQDPPFLHIFVKAYLLWVIRAFLTDMRVVSHCGLDLHLPGN